MTLYTTEDRESIKTRYIACETDDERDELMKELAETFKTSKHSIRQILVNMGVYKKKTYKTKRGQKPLNKEQFVTKMEEFFNVPVGRLESLTKANKETLHFIMKQFIREVGDPRELFKDVL